MKDVKFTNPEIVVSAMLNKGTSICADEIFSSSKEIKNDVSISVITSYLARNSNNPKINKKYIQNSLFNYIGGSPKKYEIINKNNSIIVSLNNSFNDKMNKINNRKLHLATDLFKIFNMALLLDKSEFDKLCDLLAVMKK